MTYKAAVLPVLDFVRGTVPGLLGLRPWTVTIRVRTWSGNVVGKGTKTDVDTVIKNAGYNPNVTQMSTKDIVASGGFYTAGMYRIGPITPPYTGGGTLYGTLDPPVTTTAREVFYKIEGPGFTSGGDWFTRVEDSVIENFRTEIIVKASATTP